MEIEDCDMCDMGCIACMCGTMAFTCGPTGPGWLACIVVACGLSILGCCILG